MVPRLKTGLWVQSQIRQSNIDNIPLVVVRRGDPDSGTVLIVVQHRDGRHTVYSQVYVGDGGRGWMRGTGPSPVAPEEAQAYVERAIARDYDIWVIEVEDRDGRFKLDGKIV